MMQEGRTGRVLDGQSAVVTGASTGIGRAIAIELARCGANVLIHARAQREKALDVAARARREGVEVDVVLADLAEADACRSLADRAFAWSEIGIWVNNAGVDVLTGEAADWSFEEKLERLWQVDVMATMRLSKNVGQRMRWRGRGVIINMGWDQAQWGMEGDSGEMFAAVKGAVMAFSRSLAKSLAPHVRVNCLAPGWIRTAWGEQSSEPWQQRARQECLLDRWGTPEEVARACRFLASPDAAFINGQVLPVNGGRRVK